MFTIGIIFSIALLIGIGALSGKKSQKSGNIYSGKNSAGAWLVCGTVMGTLVGGQTTIGTAQLAFTFGVSAWWFALGSTLGCLLLALHYAKPLRDTGCNTLMEIVGKEYGHKVELVGSLLNLLSIFISILSQFLAAAALITSFFPVNFLQGTLIAALLMGCYVLMGGAIGAGAGGLVKLTLLYISCLTAGICVLGQAHGFGGLFQSINSLLEGTPLGEFTHASTHETITHNYLHPFARGVGKDLGSALSLALGVLSTQTYAHGILMGKDLRSARKGALRCALLIPPIGAASILIGLYMRGNYITQAELEHLQEIGAAIPDGIGVIQSAAQAFPMFVINVLPDWFGGIVIGTLLVTVIGSGSGLTLGAAAIFTRDVAINIATKIHRATQFTQSTKFSRISIILFLVAGMVVSTTLSGGFINDLGFLSLGLRAATLLIPLSCALWHKGRFSANAALASMLCGTAMMLVAKFAYLPLDPMFWGLAAGFLAMGTGTRKH